MMEGGVLTILSLDWDFFCPSDPMWDLGHREAEFFVSAIWRARGGLISQMNTSGAEDEFWTWIQNYWKLDTNRLHVSESHLDVHTLMESHSRLILVDAHHDCWSPTKVKTGWNIDCATWATSWLRRSPFHRMLWIRPDWQTGGSITSKIAKDIRKQITIVAMSKVGKLSSVKKWLGRRIDDAHICRSGCWSPPWLDEKFLSLVKSYPNLSKIINMERSGRSEVWNPMKIRWKEEDRKAVLKGYEDMRRMVDLLQDPDQKCLTT
jgi:hypothetical protein